MKAGKAGPSGRDDTKISGHRCEPRSRVLGASVGAWRVRARALCVAHAGVFLVRNVRFCGMCTDRTSSFPQISDEEPNACRPKGELSLTLPWREEESRVAEREWKRAGDVISLAVVCPAGPVVRDAFALRDPRS